MLISKGNGGANDWRLYDSSKDASAVVMEATTVEHASRPCALTDDIIAWSYATVSNGPVRLTVERLSDGATDSVVVEANGGGDDLKPIRIVRVSDTKLLLCIIDDTGNTADFYTYTISGVTLSLDATASTAIPSAFNSSFFDIAALSAARALFAGCNAGGTAARVRGLTIGAGTLSVDGSELTVSGAGSGICRIVRLTDTTAFLTYGDTLGPDCFGVVITDGTPPTQGTDVKLIDIAGSSNHIISLSANDTGTRVALIYDNTTRSYVFAVDVSGTTVTADSGVAATTSLATEPNVFQRARDVSFLENDGERDIFILVSRDSIHGNDYIGFVSFANVDEPVFHGGAYKNDGLTVANNKYVLGLSSDSAVYMYRDGSDDPAYIAINK